MRVVSLRELFVVQEAFTRDLRISQRDAIKKVMSTLSGEFVAAAAAATYVEMQALLQVLGQVFAVLADAANKHVQILDQLRFVRHVLVVTCDNPFFPVRGYFVALR